MTRLFFELLFFLRDSAMRENSDFRRSLLDAKEAARLLGPGTRVGKKIAGQAGSVVGRPKYGEESHDATAFNEAKRMQSNPNTTDARFNQSLTDVNGNLFDKIRPDDQSTRNAPLGP